MAKGYWIGRLTVTNPDGFQDYAAISAGIVQGHGGKYLVRGGKFDAVQGDARERNVVIEFESYEAALAAWNSSDYQDAKKKRDGNCEAEFVVVAGYEP
ncbi:DUF1330 domain-containing protein [Flaviflagellibacter deserti]|uniref:DUF1330 domain-containing protein n=1 Tax=Flaviflagellibacter deserti TaxID=2267266 RepID=A0ABV9Z7G2_9HYPH